MVAILSSLNRSIAPRLYVAFALFALAPMPASCADEEQPFTNRFAKTRFYDFNEPLRKFEYERNKTAMLAVRGDEHFAKLLGSAVWVPPCRRVRDSVALGGPFATPTMYNLASRELRRRPSPLPEPLPADMAVHLARRYVWYKECLQQAKTDNILPDKVQKQYLSRGRFRLSATATDLRSAKNQLVELAGWEAVNQLELELYPSLPSQHP